MDMGAGTGVDMEEDMGEDTGVDTDTGDKD